MRQNKTETIHFNIEGNLYKLPLSMNDLTIDKGLYINNILEHPNMKPNSKHRRIISIMCSIEMSELDKVSDKMIECIYPSIDTILNNCNMPLFKVLKDTTTKKYLGLIDFGSCDDITLEQYMDMDFIFNNTTNTIEAGAMLMNILYRPIKLNPLDSIMSKVLTQIDINKFKALTVLHDYKIIDKDKGDYTNHYLSNVSAGYALIIYSIVSKFKINLCKQFPIIFPSEDSIRDNGLTEELKNSKESKESNKSKAKIPSVSEIWGWYDTLNVICDNNRADVDYWLKKPIKEFFTFLSYNIQKNKELNKQLNNNK